MTFVKHIRLRFLYQDQKPILEMLRLADTHLLHRSEELLSRLWILWFLQVIQTIAYMAKANFPSLLMPINHAFEIVSRNIQKPILLFKLPLIVHERLENCM
jgi:hypothetical protein